MQGRDSGAARTAAEGMPSEESVRSELARILSNPSLQASERRRAFLRFIVEETLSGRTDRLKGYTIATAVFGRGENFDPRTDPVVRLEARRLRRDLDGYYVDAGSDDPIRISIPKGGYVPTFEWTEAASPPQTPDAPQPVPAIPQPPGATPEARDAFSRFGRSHPRALLGVALVAAAVALAALAWPFLGGRQSSGGPRAAGEPAVVVLPFRTLNASADTRYLADGLSEELVADLMGFPGFRLYTLPLGFDHDPKAEPAVLGRGLGVAYVIDGSVRIEAEEVRVATRVSDAATGRVLWTGTYDRPLTPRALARIQDTLAGDIAGALGQAYGVVQSDLERRVATAEVSSMQSYVCVLRAHTFRRGFPREDFAAVLDCLERAVRRDPGYSDAWAMLGWLHMDAGRLGYADREIAYAAAEAAATQAVALEPESTLALKALAATYHFLGRYDDSEELGRKAVELNPHDPQSLAQLGWRLAVRGKFDEGIPVLRHAIERSANPPGWYYHLIAIDLYLKGDFAQMREVAELSAVDGLAVSELLLAIACAELGDTAAAQAALKKLAGRKALAQDPAAFLRGHGATDEIVDALMSGLRKAGWTPSGA